MRNLVFIHLESLNFVNYRVNKSLFPNLSFWENKSLSFSNYYSTATSTLMVVGDLMYGGMFQYEICEDMNVIPKKYYYEKSLFDILKEQGYETKALYYPDAGDGKSAQKRKLVGFQSDLDITLDYEEYISEINRILKKEKPFALMLCNTISNVSLNHYIQNLYFESGLDRWKKGYEFIDSCIGEIIKLLCEEGLMKNTTIIFYGDHGDDYFTHGNHEGLTHAIEPYANLIHTPFWIYDNRLVENGECKDLICTIDIKNIVEMLLKMPDIRFSWHDLHIPLQKYVFARNAYAAQPERSGSFNKGYCVVDGKFLLMASNNGLELYDIEMDVECHDNLLNYFIYKDKLLHLNQELNSTMRFHYRYIFNMNTIRQIRQVFYYYRERLYEEVQKLYSIAECKNEIKELCFEKIHYI